MRKITAQDWRQLFVLLDTALELPAAENAKRGLATLEQPPWELKTQLHELLRPPARQHTAEFLRQVPRLTASPRKTWGSCQRRPKTPGGTARAVSAHQPAGRRRYELGLAGGTHRRRAQAARRTEAAAREVGAAGADRTQAREREILASLEHPEHRPPLRCRYHRRRTALSRDGTRRGQADRDILRRATGSTSRARRHRRCRSPARSRTRIRA